LYLSPSFVVVSVIFVSAQLPAHSTKPTILKGSLIFVLALSSTIVSATGAFSKCAQKTIPSDKCATLYKDQDCDDRLGWALSVGMRRKEMEFMKQGSAKAVVVKAGCKLVGK
jgi:hypothetical protein